MDYSSVSTLPHNVGTDRAEEGFWKEIFASIILFERLQA